MCTHKYTVEKLYHFQCGECNKWWSIGDHQLIQSILITCPHCGTTGDTDGGVQKNLHKQSEK